MYGQMSPAGGYYEGDVSSEELDERKVFEEAVYEMQDQTAFPTLSVSLISFHSFPSSSSGCVHMRYESTFWKYVSYCLAGPKCECVWCIKK